MFTLSTLLKTVAKQKQRIGRGEGSRRGKNAGKGNKGQTKRAGKAPIFWRGGGGEAGNSFLASSPKWSGFKPSVNKMRKLKELTLLRIEQHFENGEIVSLESLVEKKLISNKIQNVRIIKSGNLTKKIIFAEEIYLTKGVKELIK